jgi:hypothetical protein
VAADCACTTEAPCLIHYGELPHHERREWLMHLGMIPAPKHAPTERTFKKRAGGRRGDFDRDTVLR